MWPWFIILLVTFQGSIQDSITIIENVGSDCPPCYRRLWSGKKLLEMYIRRAFRCDGMDDCHRACDREKMFICEGFNYRRGNSGSGGTCELSSTPYPRMDMQRDFTNDPQCDYYEKEKGCSAKNYGPYESYPSSNGRHSSSPGLGPYDWNPTNDHERPSFNDNRKSPDCDQSRSRNSFNERPCYHQLVPNSRPGFNNDRYPGVPEDDSSARYPTDGRFYLPTTSNRRPQYDTGESSNGPYASDGRHDPNRVYGSSFGYDTNYVDNYNHHSPRPSSNPKSSRPYDNDHLHNEFYNYGGAFGYGDNYIPIDKDQIYGGSGRARECSIRSGAGFRMIWKIIRKSLLTSDVGHCENLCANEKSFVCTVFAYRYNVAKTDPTDNCLLSDVLYRDLNFYTDLEPDRDYDIYAMVGDLQTCNAKNSENQNSLDECFWRVKNGFGMPPEITKRTMSVFDMGECQALCSTSQEFTCRSFAFRYDLQREQKNPSSNCYLSDSPAQDIHPSQMPDMDGAELYERGSFGRGCEPYPRPYFSPGTLANNKKPTRKEEVCYSEYRKPCKLTPYAVVLSMRVNSENECRQRCSNMRDENKMSCMAFSYRVVGEGSDENCMLSDVPLRDLRLGLDYTYENNHVLYAWKNLDPRCQIPTHNMDNDQAISSGRPTDQSTDFYPIGSGRPESYRPNFQPPYHHRDSDPISINEHLIPGVKPLGSDKPDSNEHSSYGDFLSYGDPSRRVLGFSGSLGNDQSVFQRYTVNGTPCKKGTMCEKNSITGFWSCETETSGMDYCCEPNHHCGYSQGYSYPWCHVGSSKDQWRPCSERYYPDFDKAQPSTTDPYDSHQENHDQRGYFARHWPVTYLHREPPPNCTDSLSSANENKNSRVNETTLNSLLEEKPVDRNNSTRNVTQYRRQLRSDLNDFYDYKNGLNERKIRTPFFQDINTFRTTIYRSDRSRETKYLRRKIDEINLSNSKEKFIRI